MGALGSTTPRRARSFAAALALAGSFLLLLGAVVWLRPELVLREPVLRASLAAFLPDIRVEWSSLRWRFAPKGMLGKRSELVARGLCVRGRGFAACFDEVRLDFAFSVSRFRPRLVEVRRLIARGGTVRVHGGGESSARDLPLPDLRLPAFVELFPEELDLSRVRELEVGVPSLRVGEAGKSAWEGSLFLAREEEAAPGLGFRLELAGRGPGADPPAARGSLRFTLSPTRVQWKGSLQGAFGRWRVSTPLEGSWDSRMRLSLRPSLRAGANAFRPAVDISWSAEHFEATVGALSLPREWAARPLTVERCELEARLGRNEGFPRRGKLSCEVRAPGKKTRLLESDPRARLQAAFALAAVRSDSVTLSLSLEASAQQDIFRVDLHGAARLELGGPGLLLRRIEEPRLELDVRVPRFEKLAAVAAGTRFAVPAPFRLLRGPLGLHATLREGASGEGAGAHVELETDLAGGGQRLVTRGSAEAWVSKPFLATRAVSVEGKLRLVDVRLTAPPLGLEEPPPVFLDKRFGMGLPPEEPRKGIPVRWRLSLVTEKPARILTTAQRSPVPIAVDLVLEGGRPPVGRIAIQAMPLELFRRRVALEHVDFLFRGNAAKTGLDGELVYRNPEATVRIFLVGSTEEPRVEFASDPPLDRSQVISLLLFNKSVAELNEDEASSAGNLSQALSEGALGLASLFFLSSTPIESVGYDPATGAYSVRVRLGSRTTVSLASDFEESRRFGLRHRLGRQWAFRTEIDSQEGRENAVSTFLEWFRRF